MRSLVTGNQTCVKMADINPVLISITPATRTTFVFFCLTVKSDQLANMEEVGTTLICGPSEVTDTFMIEGALHWAREGQRVVYVTPNPLESLPPRYHESVGFQGEHFEILQLIKFMYIPDYQSLVDILVDLDTFAASPSVLFIDKLENYIPSSEDAGPGGAELLVAKTCAAAIDTMKACSRTLKRKVHLCATLPAEALGKVHSIYFDNIWCCTIDETNPRDPDGRTIIFNKVTCAIDEHSFKFRSLKDGTIVLQDIFKLFTNMLN